MAMVHRRHGWKVALVSGLVFGFGTVNWFVLSQLCFSNGLVQLWVALAVAVVALRHQPSVAAAAISLVLLVVAVFYRLNMVAFAVVWAGHLAWQLRWKVAIPVATAAAVGLGLAAVNDAYMGHPLGLYGMMSSKDGILSPTLGLALYGNLASPSRGLVVFSPWVILAVVDLLNRRNDRRALSWALALSCMGHLLLTSGFSRWHGGGSMGPRLTADVLPAWAYLAAGGLAWCQGRRWASTLAALAIAASVLIAGGHAFSDSHRWEYTPVTADLAPDRLFDWRDALVLAPFQTTPYEDRYPIRLYDPSPASQSSKPAVTFRWRDTRGRAAEHRVEVSVKHRPRGMRVTVESFPTGEQDRLVLQRDSLPASFDPTQPVVWRVMALDGMGRVVARSGWRTFSWAPPEASEP